MVNNIHHLPMAVFLNIAFKAVYRMAKCIAGDIVMKTAEFLAGGPLDSKCEPLAFIRAPAQFVTYTTEMKMSSGATMGVNEILPSKFADLITGVFYDHLLLAPNK